MVMYLLSQCPKFKPQAHVDVLIHFSLMGICERWNSLNQGNFSATMGDSGMIYFRTAFTYSTNCNSLVVF